jgi:antitoxin YefM
MSNFVAISDARANLPTLVDNVAKNLERVFITVNGQPKVVVISAEELDSIEETAEILAIPGARESIARGMEDIKKGRLITLEEVLRLENEGAFDRRSKKAAGKNSPKSKK